MKTKKQDKVREAAKVIKKHCSKDFVDCRKCSFFHNCRIDNRPAFWDTLDSEAEFRTLEFLSKWVKEHLQIVSWDKIFIYNDDYLAIETAILSYGGPVIGAIQRINLVIPAIMAAIREQNKRSKA